MKFDCGRDWAAEVVAKEQWHEWFAWCPVRVGIRDCRWLERVERKGEFVCGLSSDFWIWEYRAIEN